MQQRLVRLAQRVLQRVEDLGELEAEEALGVEARDAVGTVEVGQFAQRHVPQLVGCGVAIVEMRDELGHAAAKLGRRVDRKMPQLLVDQLRDGRGAGGVATRAQFADAREIGRWGIHRGMVPVLYSLGRAFVTAVAAGDHADYPGICRVRRVSGL